MTKPNPTAWELEKWDDNVPYKNHELNQDYPGLANTQGQIRNGEFNPAPTTEKMKINPVSDVYGQEYTNMVHSPDHYKIFPDEEVIDLIRKCLTREEFIGYCKGNILKYRLRDKHDNTEDFDKSKQYKEYLQDLTDI